MSFNLSSLFFSFSRVRARFALWISYQHRFLLLKISTPWFACHRSGVNDTNGLRKTFRHIFPFPKHPFALQRITTCIERGEFSFDEFASTAAKTSNDWFGAKKLCSLHKQSENAADHLCEVRSKIFNFILCTEHKLYFRLKSCLRKKKVFHRYGRFQMRVKLVRQSSTSSIAIEYVVHLW